jgi:hypothetical protein
MSGIFGGGGSGGGGTTQQANQYSSISPWAQPYLTSMLGAAQRQVFNMDEQGNITGINPYNAYGSYNPTTGGQYGMTPSDMMAAQSSVAAPTGLQQQSYNAAANMGTPNQFGQATQAANMGIMGALGSARQAGGYGQMGAQAGMSYGQQATNPYAVQAYMNPYLQASLAPQMQLMNQQYGQQAAQNAGQATQAGAFGGSRFGIQQAQNDLNKNLAQNQLVSNAYNQAYNTAQQNMQNAAQLGMQGAGLGLQGIAGQQAGYGQALSGAGTLGNLGTGQLAAQTGIANLQNTFGTQQQAQQQNIINQAMQNYATAQQYPMSQLGQLKGLMTGLPYSDTTTTQQQAAPSAASQLAGLGTSGIAALGLYNAANKGSTPSAPTTTPDAG